MFQESPPQAGEPAEQPAEERADRLGFLHGISSVAISSTDPHDISQRISDLLHAHVGGMFICVRLANRERSRLHIVASRGLPEGYLKQCAVVGAEEQHLVPHVYATAQSAWGPGLLASPLGQPLAEALATWGVYPQTLLVLPLKGARSTVGALTLAWADEVPLKEDDIAFFASVANILAVGVEHAYFIGDSRETAAAATQLAEVSDRLATELSSIFESLTDAVLVVDIDGMVVRANPRACELVGRDPLGERYVDFVEGLPLRRGTHGRVTRTQTMGERVLRGETIEGVQYTLERDGEDVHLLVSGSPLVSRGVVTGAVIVVRDVTERDQLLVSLTQERQRIADILASITDGFTVLDGQGVFRYVNQPYAAMTGKSAEEIVGKQVWDIFPAAEGTEFDRALHMAMVKESAVSFTQHYPPTDLWLEVRMYPSGGGASVLVSDVTERRLAETEKERLLDAYVQEIARTSLLKDAAAAASTSLSAAGLCERVLEAIQTHLDPLFAAVHLYELFDGSITRAASLGRAGQAESPASRNSCASEKSIEHLLHEGLALLTHADMAGPAEFSASPSDTEQSRWIILPIVFTDRPLGVLELAFDGQQPFTETEISLYRAVASQLGIALDNARRYQREHRIANTLQQSLLADPLCGAAIDIGRVYRSATEHVRVGGDFYDAYSLPDGRIVVSIGDVSGKGLTAAAATALVRNVLRAYTLDGDTPVSVMEKTNRVLWHFSDAESFVSTAYGLLDPATGELTYCNGGHPPPLVIRGDGSIEPLSVNGPVLGAFDTVAFAADSVTLGPDDALLLYTDGVIEARGDDGGFFGEDRLTELASKLAGQHAEKIAQTIAETALDFSDGVLRDDMAILVIGMRSARQQR